MSLHPFAPAIPSTATRLFIGTLPPEKIDFYYSNSAKTRMWDLLRAVKESTSVLQANGYKLDKKEKQDILRNVGVGLTDIIFEYERQNDTVKDQDIIPIAYNDIIKIARENNISHLVFVYQDALKWFLHSLKNERPLKAKLLPKLSYEYGTHILAHDGKQFTITLVHSPLNRGPKGWTLERKLEEYREVISISK